MQMAKVWGYRLKGSEVEARIHDSDDGSLPKGWYDDPGKCQKPVKKKAKKKVAKK